MTAADVPMRIGAVIGSNRPLGPKPTPEPCQGCQKLVEPFPIGGDWIRPRFCDPCIAREETIADERRKLEAIANAGIPRKCQRLRWDRAVIQDDDEDLNRFQARLRGFPDAEPRIGITVDNRGIARQLRDWTIRDDSLWICGPVGGGKSTLVGALAAGLVRRGIGTRYTTEGDLLTAMAEVKDYEGTSAQVKAAKSAAVFILDDAGTSASLRDWQVNVMERIICDRYDAGAPIICTSNLLLGEIADHYGQRAASRLAEMTGRRMLVLKGHDWRTGEKHEESATFRPPPRSSTSRDGRAAAAGADSEDGP